MFDKMRAALSEGRADYIELRIQESAGTSVGYSGKELESIGRRTKLGGSVRAMVKGGWGFASFNDLSQLPRFVKEACGQARLVSRPKHPGLAPIEHVKRIVKATPKVDPRDIPLDQKHALCERYNKILLAGKNIQTSNVIYRDYAVNEYLLTSDGTELNQETCFCGIMVAAVAKEGSNVQRAYESVGDLQGYQIVEGLDHAAETTARRASELLKAEPPEAGPHTVVIDPKLCGLFIHEAFGHLSEADLICENDDLRKMMRLGRRFGSDKLNVVDFPGVPGEAGSYEYDSEGTPVKKNYLIKNGILSSRLHSRETAAMMNEEPTGNARCISYDYAPIVRMSNTYMEPDTCSFEELLDGVEDGIYAVGSGGGQTDIEMFTFSAEEGFEIKNGKLGKKLRDIVLTGNVFQTLRDIDKIGSDFKTNGGLGGCGKNDQSPLRVSDGGPSVRINNVLIGGRNED